MRTIRRRFSEKIHLKKFSLLVLIAALSHSALAGPTSDDWDKVKGSPDVQRYIVGFATGLGYANVMYDNKKIPMLFCQPETLSLRADNYTDMISAKLKELRDKRLIKAGDALPVEMMLYASLKDTFPCK